MYHNPKYNSYSILYTFLQVSDWIIFTFLGKEKTTINKSLQELHINKSKALVKIIHFKDEAIFDSIERANKVE